MSTIATTIAGPKTYSAEELQALHLAMNAKAKRKKMLQKTALVTMNLIVCLFMLFPLLYTISVAFMPSGELYTMAMNIVPKHPTLENFVEAFHKIPLVRFVLNSFLVAAGGKWRARRQMRFICRCTSTWAAATQAVCPCR